MLSFKHREFFIDTEVPHAYTGTVIQGCIIQITTSPHTTSATLTNLFSVHITRFIPIRFLQAFPLGTCMIFNPLPLLNLTLFQLFRN